MTIDTELQELADLNADIFEKEIKDLSETEKVKIVNELTKYSLSDSFVELCKSLKTDKKPDYSSKKKKELVGSQLQRDVLTRDFMESLLSKIDDTVGGKIFKANLARNIKNFTKTIEERIEAGYDAPMFSALDMEKHDKILEKSIVPWLSQTITAYEKPQPATEEEGAY